jgi:hypothetical protein
MGEEIADDALEQFDALDADVEQELAALTTGSEAVRAA